MSRSPECPAGEQSRPTHHPRRLRLHSANAVAVAALVMLSCGPFERTRTKTDWSTTYNDSMGLKSYRGTTRGQWSSLKA